MEDDHRLAREGRIAHQPVECILENARKSMRIFRRRDDHGVGTRNQTAKRTDFMRHRLTIQVGIEMRQVAQLFIMLNRNTRRSQLLIGPEDGAIRGVCPKAATKDQYFNNRVASSLRNC